MLTVDYAHCTGCRACEQICPKHCIQMRADSCGFRYPKIQEKDCINCHLCEKACPITKKEFPAFLIGKVYAAYLKDTETLQYSSSGGMFPALARIVFKQGGTVCGCAWDTHMNAVQVRITAEAELNQIQGSKYVQSDTRNTYQLVQQDLKSGRQVLYTGTPCQIAGLKSYLGKEYGNLLTADLICHGVPSPALFQDYISWLNQKIKGRICSYNFRDKSVGSWGSFGKYCYRHDELIKNKFVSAQNDPYYYFFYSGCLSRECCYTCKYAGPTRTGDFTIGDFWGIEQFHPEFPTSQGVSALLVNTDKAKSLMKQLESELIFKESDLERVSCQNDQLKHPTLQTPERDYLMDAWHKEGFQGIYQMYLKASRFQRFKSHVSRAIPNRVKRGLRNFIQRNV